MSPKNKKFKELQTKWYQKLKESGFVDIEDARGNLKEEGSHRKITKRAQNKAEIESKIEKINQYLEENEQLSPNVKRILEAFAQGVKQIRIAYELDLSYDYVREVVSKTLSKI